MKLSLVRKDMVWITMKSDNFEVWVENIKVAENMSLEYAIIFLRAIFMEFNNELTLKVSIRRMDNAVKEG